MPAALHGGTHVPCFVAGWYGGGVGRVGGLGVGRGLVRGGRRLSFGAWGCWSKGPAHLYEMLVDDLTSNMIQIAATHLSDLPELLHKY